MNNVRIPVIWLLALNAEERNIAEQILTCFREANVSYCIVDFEDKTNEIGIKLCPENLTRAEAQPIFDCIHKELISMGFQVESR